MGPFVNEIFAIPRLVSIDPSAIAVVLWRDLDEISRPVMIDEKDEAFFARERPFSVLKEEGKEAVRCGQRTLRRSYKYFFTSWVRAGTTSNRSPTTP
jgi:hypothetical protein